MRFIAQMNCLGDCSTSVALLHKPNAIACETLSVQWVDWTGVFGRDPEMSVVQYA